MKYWQLTMRIVFFINVFLLSAGITNLYADTVSWPVSVAIPTGITGELDSKPVSVGMPASMLGELDSLPASVTVQSANLGDPDLVGLWHMDGNWGDSSGNSFHLIPNNTGFSSDKKIGSQSGSFNGSSAFSYIPTAPSALNLTTNFTIMGWLNPKAAQWVGIVDSSQENVGSWEIWYDTDQSISYRHNWNRSQGIESAYSSAGSVPLNVWTHFALVYTDKKVSFYINGKEDLNSPKTFNNNPVPSSSNWFEIGVNRPGADEYFNGLIDEVAVYKRALTAEEIAFHYNSTIVDSAAPASPVLDTVPAVVGANTITLSGTKAVDTSIWANGKKIALQDSLTTWQGTYGALQPGTNILNITAVDSSYRVSQPVTKTVFYDNIPPVIASSVPANSSNTAKVVSIIEITLYDANAGVDPTGSILGAAVKNSGGQTIVGNWTTSGANMIIFTPNAPFPGDTYTVTIQAADLVGNKQQQQLVFTNHDTSTPTTKATLAGTKDSAGWYSTPVTITLSADDTTDGSGITKIEYSLDSGATWQVYSTPFVVSNDGKTTLQFRATDNVGNVETAKSQEIKINKTGLVGWWKMDGDWKDSSLLANDLTPIYSVVFDPDAKIGISAAKFNGSNSYLRRASGNDLPLGSSSRTLMAWVKPSSFADPGVSYNGIIGYGQMQGSSGSFLTMRNDGRLCMAFWANDAIQSIGTSAVLNQWNHVAVTYDGGTFVSFFMNGQLVQVASISGSVPNTLDGPLRIGSIEDPGRIFNGFIDDVRIYNRALSATEITEQYRNIAIGVPTVDPVTSPVNTPTITLSGTKPANTSVVITNGSTGTEIAPQSDAAAWGATTWQGTITLKSGMNNLNITAKDVDGYHSQQTTLSVALDDTSPTVASSDPVNSGIFKTPVSTITFNLQDAFSPLDLSATIAHATVKSNSGLDVLGTWTTSGSGSSGSALFTAASPMGEGTYTATITPTDSFSNQSTANVNFTVDMTAPVPPTIDPITVPINTTTRTITGTKSSDSSRVVVASPGASVGTVSYPSGATTWSVTVSGLKEGVNTVTAYAIDAAGNQSSVASATFTVDLTAPAKPVIDSPVTPTNKTGTTLTGGKEANSYLYINNAKTSAGFGDTTWSAGVTLSEGNNTITVFARDEAGNQSQSTAVSIFRDTTAPTVSASTPSSNGVSGSADTISITLADGTGGAGVDLQASLAGAVVKDNSGSVINGTWRVSGSAIIFTPASQLAEGKYTVTIYPVDNLGNKGSAAFSFTLDRAPPSVAALALSPVSPVKAGTVTFTVIFSEAMDSAVQPTVTFGAVPYAITGSWQGDKKSWKGTYAFTVATGDGAYTVTVKGAKDLAGNTMTDQTAGSFTLDTTAPTAPTATAVMTPTKITTQTITGTKPADTAIVINGTVRVPINSATAWSYNYPLTEGANTLSITARDAAGNDSAAISPAPVITLDTTPPVFTVDVIKNPSPTVTQTISGKKEAGAIVTLNGTTIFDATEQNATWSYDLTLIDGITNHLVFTAADALGNTTTKTLDVLCDISPPQALAAGMLVADGSGKGTEVTLSWPSYMEPADLAYYRIYSATADFTTVTGLTPLGTVNKGTKTFKATGLIKGSTYYFAAVPVSASGNADPTVHTAQGIPADTAAPEDVTGLAAWAGYTPTDGNYVTLTWTASKDTIGDLADQTVYMDAGQGYDSGTAVGKTVLTHTKKGLNDATVHKFKVTTKDASGHESSGTVITAVTRLANPTGLAATPGSGKVALSWTAVNSPYVKLYNIYRLKSDDQQTEVSTMTLVKSQTGTSFTDTGLVNGSTYQYAVTTLNTFGAEKTTVQSISALPRNDTTGPVIGGVNITFSQIITAPLAISASATDAESSIDRIDLRIDDVLVKTATGSSISYPWNVVTAATDGNHTIKLSAYDGPGNLTEQTIPVVVSLAPPKTPAITGHSVTATTPAYLVTVNGTSALDTTVSLKVNGVPVGQPAQVTAAGVFTFTGIQLAEGSNVLAVKAAHRGGESPYSADYRIAVDTGPPPAPYNLAGKVLAGGAIQFTWLAGTGEVPAGYNLYESNAPFAMASSTGVRKANSVSILYPLKEYIPADDALRYYAVTTLDAAGNESPISALVSIAADRLSPAISEIRYSYKGQSPVDQLTVGTGTVKITFTVNKPLAEIPFFSLEPQAGSPIVIPVSNIDDTHYQGSYLIDYLTPHGTTKYNFSGKDSAGNRGTSKGAAITIDVKGPVATILSPQTLLKITAGPVPVTLVFDEPSTIIPGVILKAASGASVAVTNFSSTDNGLHWSGVIDPATLPEGSGTFLLTDSRDSLGNQGNKIAGNASLILYQTTPPAPAVPTGLTAKAAKGGSVALSWDKTAGAGGYVVYRKGGADAAAVPIQTIGDGNVTTYADSPPADGSYDYSVSALGLLNAESGRCDAVAAVSDRTAPAAPTGLLLTLTGNGVKAQWSAPASEPTPIFRLYRIAAPVADVAGLHAVTEVKTTTAMDTAPDSKNRFYVVTALDGLGNESAPSEAMEIVFPVAPVRNMVLSRIDDGKPTLVWEAGEQGLQGYNIYRNGNKINQTPTISTSFSDGYYAGGAVTYGVSAVNSLGIESLVKEISMPLLTIELKEGTTMRRGLLETVPLVLKAQADAGDDMTVDGISVKIGELPESYLAGPFSVKPGVPLDVQKIAATDAGAPERVAVVMTAVLSSTPGSTVKITRSSVATVLGTSLALEIYNEPLVRGLAAKVRIKLNNVGSARTEVVTSENGGPTSQVKVVLRDQDGNVLAQGNLNQRAGEVVDNGSFATARIEPGASYISEPITFVVPAHAPYRVILEAVVTNTYFHYGLEDQVTAPGMRQRLDATIADVAYNAYAHVDKPWYLPGQTVGISGNANSTFTGAPMANVPVKIGITARGYDRFQTVTSDSNGLFSYSFPADDYGAGDYKVWAMHPEMNDRTIQAQFSIAGLTVTPATVNLKIVKGESYNIPVRIINTGGTAFTGLALADSASSGVKTVITADLKTLNPGETRDVLLNVSVDKNSPDNIYARLDVSTAEGLGGTVNVNIASVMAIPLLDVAPTYIDTGIVRSSQRMETFSLKNSGTATLVNAHIEGPSLPWLALSIDPQLGDISAGQSRTVGILVKPDDKVAQGIYNDRVVIHADNHTPYIYNIQVTVTTNAVGNVQFSVLDELMKKVEGASITFQNQSVPELIYTLKTDAGGLATSFDLPEGRYAYTISASNHYAISDSFVITPGVTTLVPIALEVNLVHVEWSVTPVVLKDTYDLTVTQTFETNVPTPVLVTEPPSITLPELQPGQVFNGEFKVSNYGLIALDKVKIDFPNNFLDYDLELFLTQIPERIPAMKSITIPYRVVRRSTQPLAMLTEQLASFGGGCISTSWIKVSGEAVICPDSAQEKTVGKSSYYSIGVNVTCPSQSGKTGIPVSIIPIPVVNYTGPGCANGCSEIHVDPPVISVNLNPDKENPCKCQADGVVVGVCKECKDQQPIDSPDRTQPGDSPALIEGINSLLEQAKFKIGKVEGTPSVSANSIQRCCGAKGWRAGEKASGTISFSGPSLTGSKEASISIAGRIGNVLARLKAVLVKADYEVSWSGSATAFVDSDPCDTGCNSQMDLNATAKVTGSVSTPSQLSDLFIVSGSVNGSGNMHISSRCGTTTSSGCLGPINTNIHVNFFGALQSLIEDLPIIPASCF